MDAPLLTRIEHYYDTVPRRSARAEDIGPFTLFVREGEGWPFYARPRHGRDTGAITADDVRRVRARQREAGVPEAFEWVEELAPDLGPAAEGAGLEVHRHPLMVLRDGIQGYPATSPLRLLGAGDPDVAAVFATVDAAFRGTDHVPDPPPAVPHVRPLLLDGSLRLVGAYDGQDAAARPVGGGSHAPRGQVTELAGIGVLPGARRRGTGAAVTAALVSDALELGVRTLFLSAGSAEVAAIYARVGFQPVATACIAGPVAAGDG